MTLPTNQTKNMTTQSEIREAFWAEACPPGYARKNVRAGRSPSGRLRYRPATQNEYPADIRCAWCDFVEHLRRNGRISESLASRVTL